MRHALVLTVAAVLGLMTAACQSTHEKGVNSDYRSQWTTVNANTKKTTDAAKAILNDEGLQDVKANATMVDGTASAKEADGTMVNVAIDKITDNSSKATVTVGTMGDPKLGADIAKKIKDRAEGGRD